jgi:hypothetical protein
MTTKITPPPADPFTGIASEVEPIVYTLIRSFLDLNSARSSQLAIAMANGIEWSLKNKDSQTKVPPEFEDSIRSAMATYNNRCREMRSDDAVAALIGIVIASIRLGAKKKA